MPAPSSKKVTLMRAPVSAVLAAAVCLGPAAAGAAADDGTNVPARANPIVWADYAQKFAAANAIRDWNSVSGELVADSGFRPFNDGFSFFNTAAPDPSNAKLFGTDPAGPKNLNAATMRSMIGKRVCVERRATGPCTLTLSAREWMRAMNGDMSGGHCFGFAATASMLYEGSLQPRQFQPGVNSTYSLALKTPISRTIARNMATQYLNDTDKYLLKPSQVAKRLAASLRPGVAPPVLVMGSGAGGHAVTPYALYDKGDGRYDVAIYDNNYPDFRRVVRLDATNEQAQYTFSANPNAQTSDPTLDDIGLVPLGVFKKKKQRCAFCPGANQTQVTLSPVRTDVPLGVKITSLSGNRIKAVTRNLPTNPWEPGKKWSFPSFTVPKKKTFVVRINAKQSSTPIRTTVSAVSGSYTLAVNRAGVPAGGIGKVGLRPSDGIVVYQSKYPKLGQLRFVDTVFNGNSTLITARAKVKNDSAILGGLDEKAGQVILFTADGKKGSVQANAIQSGVAEPGPVGTSFATLKAKLGKGERVLLDYSRWAPDKPRALKAYIVSGKSSKPLKLRFPKPRVG